jgi:integrase
MAAGGDDAAGLGGVTRQPLGPRPTPERPRSARPGAVKSHLAAETLRLYAGDWVRFSRFCAERGETALPAAPTLVAAFLAGPSSGKAVLPRRLAAIDHQHRQHGFPPPGADPELRAALRQARRTAPVRRRPPGPTRAALERMAQSCRGDLAGQRDRALLLLLAAGLGRTAIVSLAAERLRFSEAGVTHGAHGDERAPVRLPRSPTIASCPVRALEDWLRSSGTRYGPVFRKINRWGALEHTALGVDAIRRILERRHAAHRPGRQG